MRPLVDIATSLDSPRQCSGFVISLVTLKVSRPVTRDTQTEQMKVNVREFSVVEQSKMIDAQNPAVRPLSAPEFHCEYQGREGYF
jgi:hypothetical protein